ncbi:MAG TPA: hypothetical protein VG965_04695 [Patescibacteria group bacterium]|nr:hypothetical protein [Patescibacteria group bacterium]
MLYIISGDDTASSRQKLLDLVGGEKNVTRIDGKKQGVVDIEMSLASSGLFSEKKKVIVEFFSKIKAQDKLADEVSKVVKDSDLDVILWDENAPGVKLTKITGVNILSYTFPKLYFQFLDGLSPSNPSLLKLFHQVLKSYVAEQVLFSVVKRLRQLMIVKGGNYQEFSEFKNAQAWQIGKLQKQASLWSEEGLRQAFVDYSGLEEKMKTSMLTMDLADHLDILLMGDL